MGPEVAPDGPGPLPQLALPSLRQGVGQEVPEQVGVRVLGHLHQVRQVELEVARELKKQLKTKLLIFKKIYFLI